MKWVWQGQRLLQGPGGWSILSLWTWKNEVMFGAGLGWMNCFCPGRMDGWSPLDCCLHYNVVVGARIWSVSSIYPSIFGMDDPFLPTTHSLLLVLEVSVWPEVPYPRLTLSVTYFSATSHFHSLNALCLLAYMLWRRFSMVIASFEPRWSIAALMTSSLLGGFG